MKKLFILLMTCISLAVQGYAQAPEVLPQVFSPNAAELGKYGKVPVSYFNGLPNISIPLTELKAKGYTLPIYLTYHAGGNKPDQHPGWVGLGWTLHAGGCINRIVKGEIDEMSLDEYSRRHGYKPTCPPGYLDNAAEIQSKDWMDSLNLYLTTFPREVSTGEYAAQHEMFIDHDPDEFMVNVEGLQASFYFVGPDQIQIESQSDVSFTVTYSLSQSSNEKITLFKDPHHHITDNVEIPLHDYIETIYLTTDDGTKYTFGGSMNAIELSFSCSPNYNYDHQGNVLSLSSIKGTWDSIVNTWQLTTIERPNGEVVTFEYARDGVPIAMVDSHHYYYYKERSWPNPSVDSTTGSSFNLNINYSFLYPSYLCKITSLYGKDVIEFNRTATKELKYVIKNDEFQNRVQVSEAARNSLYAQNYYMRLNKIKTKRGDIQFEHTEDTTQRLRLLGVEFLDSLGNTKKYSMEYNPETLPSYNSRKIDAWGFYSRPTQYSCIDFSDFQGMNATRRQIVDAELMQAEMLTKITYPTGGSTVFKYEPHDYGLIAHSFPFSLEEASGMAGGLRIKRMTDYSASGEAESRVFTYMKDGHSSGILAGAPSFYESGVHTTKIRCGIFVLGFFGDYYIHLSDEEIDADYFFFSEQTLVQIPMTRGSAVTYTNVIEERPGIGKTVYKFSNHDTSDMRCNDHGPINIATDVVDMNNPEDNMAAHFPLCSFEGWRGLLREREDYDHEGRLVYSEKYSYLQDTTQSVSAISRMGFKDQLARASYYKHYTGFPALKRKIITRYSDVSLTGITEDCLYDYDVYRNVINVKRSVSNFGTEETSTLYSGDDSLAHCAPYREMQAAGILDRPVEQTILRDGKVVSSSLITYKKSGNQFVPDKYYEARLDSPIPESSWDRYDGHAPNVIYGAPKISFDSYDDHGNILTATEEGGFQSQHYWDAKGYLPEASFSGIPSHETPVNVESSETQSTVFQGARYRTYTFGFDADYKGVFTFSVESPYLIECDMYGTLDGKRVFDHTPPGANGEIYTCVVSAGHHTFTVGTNKVKINSPNIPGKYELIIRNLEGTGIIQYPVYQATTATDKSVWYYDFEIEGNSNIGFHSQKSWMGSKTFNHAIPSGVSYVIDWMERSGSSKWSYHSKYFSGNTSIGNNSSYIDNVRIYPSDAAVTSWTWNNLGDLSSVTDGRGITEYYEYDGLGRLTTITDMDGHKKASYAYHYVSASDSTNYVRTNLYTDELGQKVRSTINYFDGLGRPWQTVRMNAGNDEEHPHLAEKTNYDAAGRPFLTWLPFRTSSLLPQVETPLESLYSDSEPYSFIEYDGSPLDRPIAEYGPGVAWHASGKAVRHAIYTNDSSTTLSCQKYTLNWTSDTTATINRNDTIPYATLSVESVKDEDGLELLTFKDLYGQILLERRHPVSGGNLDTYYLYDGLGRLSAVLPPELSKKTTVSHSDINNYAYLYRYDARGNCIAKKLPGCGWSFMVYDARGTMVMSQDAEQRKAGQWTLTLTDGQGRQCLTGTCTASLDVFGNPYGEASVYVRKTGDNGFLQHIGEHYGYTMYMITPQNFNPNQATLWSPFGPTERYDRVLGPASGGKMLKTTYTYDAKGRVIRTESQTHLGGLETENLTYSFMDEVLTRNLVHTDATGQSSNELYTYTYDHWGRPLQTIHQLGSGNGVILHDNVYDGIGRLMADNRCGALSLPTSYAYNVRSWLMGIQSDLFCEVMSYEAPGTGITSRWGGNISQIVWRSGAETNSRKYAFTYDGYGRLAGAAYSSLRAGDYSTSYAYDANSNLTSITRMAIDGLSGGGAFIPGGIGYILSGNQVALRLQGSSGFNAMAMTANASGADFRQVYYDACGRMVRDDDRGIKKITYNELHLPATIQRVASGYSSVKYGVQYAADGRKLRTGRLDSAVEPTFNGTNDSLEDASEASVELTESIPIINAGIDDGRREREPLVCFITTTDYVGNLVYKDGILEKVLVDGGFITAADMRYHFFVTDHLGNVRVVVNDAGVVEQVNQFYPYGEATDMGQVFQETTDNPYKWSGKEWNEDQGAYDFGARMYSAADARWTTMDPLSEKYYHISPYAYCAGNPVNLVDPDGRFLIDYYNTSGKFIGTDGDENNKTKYIVLSSTDQKVVKKNDKEGKTTPLEDISSAVPVPSDKVVDAMENAYNLTENTGKEHLFAVGVEGSVSSTVAGEEGEVSNAVPVAELNSNGEHVAYDVHTHPKGTAEKYGAAVPSTTDKVNAINSSGQPSVVLGYEWHSVPQPANTIGGAPSYNAVRYVGYYNRSGAIGTPVRFDTFKYAVNKINRSKK